MTTTSRPQAPRYDDVIDLERYPIHDRASIKYQAVVQGCRHQLRDRGVAQLDGFLVPAAVSEMVALAPGDETERAHPETVLRPHRLTGLRWPHC